MASGLLTCHHANTMLPYPLSGTLHRHMDPFTNEDGWVVLTLA